MKSFLEKKGVDFIPQYPVGSRRIDFYVPSWNMFIECDSKAFHNNPEQERKRDLEILLQCPDKKIAHVIYGNNPPKWEVFDLSMLNHTGTFSFMDVPIIRIKKYKLKRNSTLYNFAVEDNESYVAKGVIVHNCRCSTFPEVLQTPPTEQGTKE